MAQQVGWWWQCQAATIDGHGTEGDEASRGGTATGEGEGYGYQAFD